MSEIAKMYTCTKCKQVKPLEDFYTNTKTDKSKPYWLVCRKCYQTNRRSKKKGNQKNAKSVIMKQSLSTPAQLTCTIKEFHNFIEPKIRNDIQTLTKGEKRKLNNICQNCGKQGELHASHIKGNDRVQIVNDILKRYIVNEKEQIIQVDLDRVKNEIKEAHKPISEHFKFLCFDCHRKYDSEK